MREIQLYIARDSPAAAALMIRRLRSTAARLAEYPESGRTVPDYADTSIRELIIGPYRLVDRYVPGSDRVQIVHVSHASRQLPRVADER